MFKKLTAAALAVVLTLGAAALPMANSGIDLTSITASAETYGDYYYEFLDDGTVEITGYNGNETEVTIPSSINGKKVTSIGDDAFFECTSLTSITIPDGVTNIGGGAFDYCFALENITIPDSVTSIGVLAFGFCSSLTNIIIPDSVTNIGQQAFEFCASLTNIIIPDSVTSINVGTFSECYSLTNITIPNSVTYIGGGAFFRTPWLSEKRKENPLVIINNILVDGKTCKGDIVIPDSVTSIGESAFGGCSGLTSITIPEGVTSIGIDAFYGCEGLTNIAIPDSVTNIGEGAFGGCKSIKSITIPKNVTKIDKYAFGYSYEYVEDYHTSLYMPIPDFKIYCYSNTAGEKYAKDNWIKYECIDKTCAAPVAKTNYTNTCSEIRINWNKVSGVTGYKIFRYDDAKKKWVDVKAIYDPNATNYKITSLAPNTSYKFMVKSFVKVGSKVYFSDASKTITAKTKAIAKLTGKTNFTYTTNAVRINWNKISGVTGYKVYRYDDAKKTWVAIKTIYDPNATNYKISGLSAGKVYKFRVKAFVKSGSKVYYGDSCNTISTATRPNTTKITKSNKASTAVRLYWNKTTCSGYRIEKYDSAKKKWVRVTAVGSPSTTQYRISGLKKNTTYKFRIQPYVKVGSKVIYGTASATYTVKTTK